jgi:hypothetical protein
MQRRFGVSAWWPAFLNRNLAPVRQFGEGVCNTYILQAAVESAAAHGKRIELT